MALWGSSKAEVYNLQTAKQYLSQQFSGTCDVACSNTMKDINITAINSDVPDGINISQACTVDGNCAFAFTGDIVSDVMFKAKNAPNAKDTGSWFSGFSKKDSVTVRNRFDIGQALSQSVDQSCQISSTNQMQNVGIVAVNSSLKDIDITQTGDAKGKCVLNGTLDAAAKATGIATNTPTSGKDKKGQKFGNKSGMLTILTWVGIAIVALAALAIVAKVIATERSKQQMGMGGYPGLPYSMPMMPSMSRTLPMIEEVA